MLDLNLTLIQAEIAWLKKDENLEKFSRLIEIADPLSNIIILPEMFSTGFTMDPAPVAEEMDGPTIKWMQEKSENAGAVITGSIVITENGKYYNRLIWMNPDGSFEYYDKKHLFALSGETEHYTAGTKKLIIEFKDWKICPVICYDLRFPVWLRNKEDYDLMIVVANWPMARSGQWEHLLSARAIENQCYVAGVNRIGKDGNNFAYDGTSMVVNADGDTLTRTVGFERMSFVKIKHYLMEQTRRELPFLNDRDAFEIAQ